MIVRPNACLGQDTAQLRLSSVDTSQVRRHPHVVVWIGGSKSGSVLDARDSQGNLDSSSHMKWQPFSTVARNVNLQRRSAVCIRVSLAYCSKNLCSHVVVQSRRGSWVETGKYLPTRLVGITNYSIVSVYLPNQKEIINGNDNLSYLSCPAPQLFHPNYKIIHNSLAKLFYSSILFPPYIMPFFKNPVLPKSQVFEQQESLVRNDLSAIPSCPELLPSLLETGDFSKPGH